MKQTPVNRADLLKSLEAVYPGLSISATTPQSDCFVFRKGRVYTFNGETFCKIKTTMPVKFTGAVHGDPLIRTLREMGSQKMSSNEVELSYADNELTIHAGRDTVSIRTDPEIQMPISEIERPWEWHKLPSDFSEAMAMVVECAGKDSMKEFIQSAVHVHPKWIEATDNFSFSRYRLKTGVSRACLLRGSACKSLADREPRKIAETENWLHFRNGVGLVCAVRRFDPADHKGELLLGLTEISKTRGEPCPFPKSLITGTKISEIFSAENADNNYIKVELSSGHVILRGIGVSGKASHRAKIKYTGDDMQFSVQPNTLKGLLERHTDIEVAPEILIVNNDKWCFMTRTMMKSKKKED